MAKKAPDAPAAKVALYDKLIATSSKVERKGAANAYTALNGHMFSFMNKQGKLALRFSEDQKEAFIKKFKSKIVMAYGAVMRGYAEVPDSLLKNTAELKKYFAMSIKYIESLEPKPTTKKKAVKKKATKKKAVKKVAKKKTVKKKMTKKK